MFTHEPRPITLQADHTAMKRIATFFAHYDSIVYVTDTAYAEVGRGSLGVAGALIYTAQEFVGCVGSIGQFGNFGLGCQIFCGGDHHNDKPVNLMFGGLPLINDHVVATKVTDLRTIPAKPFNIGHAVLFSADCKVMAGTTIGDSAVIAAGAFVKGDLDPFGIYGGVPGKKLRERVDKKIQERLSHVRWWDFDIVYLLDNIARLQEVAIDTEAMHVYRKPTPKLVWRSKKNSGDIDLVGFFDGTLRPVTDLPEKALNYVKQAVGPGPHYWLADMWA